MTKVYKLAESFMQPAESVHQEWAVIAPYGVPREATLKPEFWVHVARKLRPMAYVRVTAEGGAWHQQLLCQVSDGSDVRMKELGFWELDDTSDVSDKSDAMRVEWAGPYHQFRVMRNADNVVLEKNFKTRADAARWLANNSRTAA